MIRSVKINNSFIYQSMIILFSTLLLLRMYIGTHIGIFGLVLTASYALLGIFLTISFKLKTNSLIFWFIILMLFLGITTAIFGKNYEFRDILYLFAYYGIALIPVYIKLNYKLFLWFAYSVVLFFLIFVFKGIHPNEVLYSSQNGFSEILLIVLGYHLISSFQNEKKPSIILIGLGFALTIWAIGRGGIIAVGLILFAYPFMLKFELNKKYKKYLFFLLISASPFMMYSIYPDIFKNVFERFIWFTSRGYSVIESPRLLMNLEYLKAACSSLYYFLFGVPLEKIPTIVKYDLNTHNSLINAHVYYGFWGFLLLVILIGYAGYYFVMTKNYIYLTLLVALFIRAFVDSNAFHGAFDTIFYYLMFYVLKD